MKFTSVCIRSKLTLLTLLFSFLFVAAPGGEIAKAQADRDSTGQYGYQGLEEDNSPTLWQRLGFRFELDASYFARFIDYRTNWANKNAFTANERETVDQPVNYSSKVMSVGDLAFSIGMFDRPLFDFEYQSSLPRNEFQEQALSYQENVTEGLEKYTFGINTAPLWMLILPDDTPWYLKNLLSVRFRTFREYSESSLSLTNSGYLISQNSQADPQNPEVQDFEPMASSDSYSFQTRYNYTEIAVPLIDYSGDMGGGIDGEKETVGSFWIWLSVGGAKWSFERPYATQFSRYNNDVVAYNVSQETMGPTADFSMDIWFDDPLGGANLSSIESYVRAGWGMSNTVENDEVNLDRLFLDNGELDLTNTYFEADLYVGFKLFTGSNNFSMDLKPGLRFFTFSTYISNFEDIPADFDNYEKTDFVVYPSLKMSFSYRAIR